jgi:hypothetical protein
MAGPLRLFPVAIGLFVYQVISGVATASDERDLEIVRALYKPTIIDFVDVPLTDGVEFLADNNPELSLQLDEEALKAAKIDSRLLLFTYKSPVVNNTSRYPFYRALWDLFRGTNLSFMVKDHKLLVTTVEAAEVWQKGFAKLVESGRAP